MWREHGIDPEWLESIPFYEYQIWLNKLNDTIEAENAEAQNEGGMKQVFNLKK